MSDTNSRCASIRSIHGGVAIQAGFLVAFKQLVPEHTVTIAKGIIKIRVKVCAVLGMSQGHLSG